MKLVVFTLCDKEYGVNISEVREVIRLRAITRIPEVSNFVEGVIALRGAVIPLVNLRAKLGMEKSGILKSSRIIITQVDSHDVGLIVDSVSDVISLDPANITPPDEMLKGARYLVGVAKKGERLIVIMDIGKLFSDDISSDIQKVHERVEIRHRR
ncbi:MAG: purine-binding chemotaxis protein CheW [Candidatus Omnitrophica bacterium]|nr:purine-binding chemotaxis protein CheW [Candidatus Omnitrophota bacterium]